MLSRFYSIVSIFLIVLSAAFLVSAQTPSPTPKPEAAKTQMAKPAKGAAAPMTAEQIAESALVVYAFPGGRETLKHIRKTAFEKGKIVTTDAKGKVDRSTYQRWTIRGESLDKEKIRLDQEFPTARYALVFNEDKIFGIYNDAVFTPRDDAARAFQNQISYGIDSLLRYKENGSTIAFAGRDKQMGVEYYMIDVTDKQQRKARFYISVKSFRIMFIEYEDAGVKYKRRYYNYNYAQGTLVPYRSVLYADGKVVEETEIGTVTYGQKIDEGLFPAG